MYKIYAFRQTLHQLKWSCIGSHLYKMHLCPKMLIVSMRLTVADVYHSKGAMSFRLLLSECLSCAAMP